MHNRRSDEKGNQKPVKPKIKRAATEREASKARKGHQHSREWAEQLSLFFHVTNPSLRKRPPEATREPGGGHYDLSKPASKLGRRKGGNDKVGGANR